MPPKRKSASSAGPATPLKANGSSQSHKQQQPSSGGWSSRSARTQKVTYVEVDSDGNEVYSSEADAAESDSSGEEEAAVKGRGAKGKGKAAAPAKGKGKAAAKLKVSPKSKRADDEFAIELGSSSEDASGDSDLSSAVSEEESDDSAPAKRRKTGGGSAKGKAAAGKGKSAAAVKAANAKANAQRSSQASATSNGKDGGRTVITLAKAPSQPPPANIISQTMMDFLRCLQDPEKNDRDWFQQNDALYRYTWDNWNTFVTTLLPRLMEEADETLPFLPAKDMVYRIYRDVRFSADKTPYKTYMSATFSRGGRKGAFAGYHLEVRPGQSFLAGGRWSPIKEHLQKFRQHLIDDDDEAQKLKAVLNEPELVKLVGAPKPGARGAGKASSVFGHEDELKIAPKIEGVDKTHPQIAWLKLRSFYVMRSFTDADVLKPGFMDEVVRSCKLMQPLIEQLNDMCYPPPTPPPSDSEEEED